MIDYYTELSLDETLSCPELVTKLTTQRYQWLTRASRAGSISEKAKRKLELIDEALAAFVDEETRDDYDMRLLRFKRSEGTQESEVDWLDRAWSYFFMDELGPAEIAARNARGVHPNSADPFVISTWVSIKKFESVTGKSPENKARKEGYLRDAQNYADEALVLDELGSDTTEVHHVRGVVFHLSRQLDKALRSYDRALKTATETDHAVISWRKMRVLLEKNQYRAAYEISFDVLIAADKVTSSQLRAFINDTKITLNNLVKNSTHDWVDTLILQIKSRDIPNLAQEPIIHHLVMIRNEMVNRIERGRRLRKKERVLKESIRDKRDRLDRLDPFSNPGEKPSLPFLSLPYAIILTGLVVYLTFRFGINDGDDHSPLYFIFTTILIAFVRAVYALVKRYKWHQNVAADSERQALVAEIGELESRHVEIKIQLSELDAQK